MLEIEGKGEGGKGGKGASPCDYDREQESQRARRRESERGVVILPSKFTMLSSASPMLQKFENAGTVTTVQRV